jgi:hypothetical protein
LIQPFLCSNPIKNPKLLSLAFFGATILHPNQNRH